jgi:hypothetical protein
MTRALGEMPAPVPHESLRGRMAALHAREDPLLEPAAFARLLRQANDAEVADVRMLAEGQFEVSPHKTDLALQLRPAAEPATNGATATVARPASALRFRSGSMAAKRTSAVPMVGVVKLDGPAEAPAAVAPVERVAEEPAPKKASRRGGKKTAAKSATAPAKEAKAPKKRSRAKRAKSAPKSDAT